MRRRTLAVGLFLVGTISLVILGWLLLTALQPGLIPKVLGTGGYVTEQVTEVRQPFSFDRPRLWTKRQYAFLREPVSVYIQGPIDDAKIRFVELEVRVGDREQYSSLQDFVDKVLPSEQNERRQVIADTKGEVGGIPSRDIEFTYTYVGVFPGRPDARVVPSRGRSVIFEYREQFTLLEYSAAEEDYDRYVEVLDRAVRSFKFLN